MSEQNQNNGPKTDEEWMDEASRMEAEALAEQERGEGYQLKRDLHEGNGGDDGQQQGPESFIKPVNAASHVSHVIGVVSGKGGVGKSMVTSLLAVELARRGYKTAVMDADVTGPSIPKAFGLKGPLLQDEAGIIPAETADGIKVISLNLLLPDETDPVVWRGPIISGTVQQFWTEVHWGDIDYMLVDMPPGTGDVALTVFQSIPLDGIIIVTSPQDLVSMIVTKAVKMAEIMNVRVLGIVENMSYFVCPDCGAKHYIFGHSTIDGVAAQHGTRVLDHLPLDPEAAQLADSGRIEEAEGNPLKNTADEITKG
ncbi:MAG: P-loop NTPase [Lachnospiraceae bacterium]|jgi:Mrp family chromosome partitioning ATPase